MTTKLVLILTLLASMMSPLTSAAYANAPGGAYIQCDPGNPSSPVRCSPDSW
ncbi:MAG TPA: hypothetical protein VMC05_01500 [Xanthobacteraceae bacterium]|nr:hypothetical protein [Xanthobacteraceae bacterium]